MIKLVLTRLSESHSRTLGRLVIYNGLNKVGEFTTLELAWRGNSNLISCIPVGDYVVKRGSSKRFEKHLRLYNVGGRTDVLMHIGNYPKDSTGCILVGAGFSDIDGCGEMEVTSSKTAIARLYSLVDVGVLTVI